MIGKKVKLDFGPEHPFTDIYVISDVHKNFTSIYLLKSLSTCRQLYFSIATIKDLGTFVQENPLIESY